MQSMTMELKFFEMLIYMTQFLFADDFKYVRLNLKCVQSPHQKHIQNPVKLVYKQYQLIDGTYQRFNFCDGIDPMLPIYMKEFSIFSFIIINSKAKFHHFIPPF
jgi:hypothetical protein